MFTALVIFTVSTPLSLLANSIVVIDRLHHKVHYSDDNSWTRDEPINEDNSITLAYSYDSSTGVVCVLATATMPGGAATSNKCYRSDKEPNFTAENFGEYEHKQYSEGRMQKTVFATVFKVHDKINKKTCYGTYLNRVGLLDNYSDRFIGDTSISLDCI